MVETATIIQNGLQSTMDFLFSNPIFALILIAIMMFLGWMLMQESHKIDDNVWKFVTISIVITAGVLALFAIEYGHIQVPTIKEIICQVYTPSCI